MRSIFCTAAFVLAVAANASAAPSSILFEKASAGDIKTIGIVTMAMPALPNVQHYGGISDILGGGLLVGVVEQSNASARQKEFWREIDGDHRPPQTTFSDALTVALQADGYSVKLITAPRSELVFLENYPADAKVDAILDIAFSEEMGGYGYLTPGQENSNPYKPFAYVSFRLVRTSDQSVLAQNTVLYTPWWKQDTDESLTIPPDEKYTFNEYEAIKANPALATEGLNTALTQTAGTIGLLLN
jgi:hypothetical protein